jgi:hypothetical protein
MTFAGTQNKEANTRRKKKSSTLGCAQLR